MELGVLIFNSFVGAMILSHHLHRWIWDIANSVDFTIKDTKNYIDNIILTSGVKPTRWNSFLPKKV